jgi:hypothetical protein
VHRGLAPAQPVAVHDIVVHEQRGVQELEGGRSPQDDLAGSPPVLAAVHLPAEHEEAAAHHLAARGETGEAPGGIGTRAARAGELAGPCGEEPLELPGDVGPLGVEDGVHGGTAYGRTMTFARPGFSFISAASISSRALLT